MTPPRLSRARDNWIDSVTRRAWDDLVPRGHQAAFADIVGEPFRSDIGRALVVAFICAQDSRATAAVDIADELVDRGMLDNPAAEAVAAVVRRYRADGAGWDAYWDTDGLCGLCYELWAAERVAVEGEVAARARCAAHLRITERKALDTLMRTRLGSVVAPPLVDATTFPAVAAFVATEVGSTTLAAEPDERLLSRPDLAGLSADLHLAERLRDEDGAVGGEVGRWRESLREALPRLTTFEWKLLARPSDDERYRHQCLEAGRGIYHIPLLLSDALPTTADAARPAPAWMQDPVLTAGARMWHARIAPYAVWFAAAEHAEELRALRHMLDTGRIGVGLRVEDTLVRLELVADEEHPDGPLAVPFSYEIEAASGAWDLLHLGATGTVRFVVLNMVDDGPLTVVGALVLPLGPLGEKVATIATARLRALLGDDAEGLRHAALGLVGKKQADAAAFLFVDRGKAEDLLVDLANARDPQGPHWGRYARARGRLAAARRQLAIALLDEGDTAAVATEVRGATAEFERSLARARGARHERSSFDEEVRTLVGGLPEATAFAHLYEKDGYLSVAWAARHNGEPLCRRIDLSHVSLDMLREAVDLWVELMRNEVSEQTATEMIVEALAPIATPIVEELRAVGVGRLVLSPMPPLDLVPVHAAPVGGPTGRRLVDEFDEVVYAPSVGVLALLASPRHRAEHGPLLVGHSGGQHGWSRIPGAAHEVETLSELHGDAVVLLDEAATPEAVLAAAPNRRIVHLAAHGFTHQDRWSCGLALAGPTPGRGALTAAHVLAGPALDGAGLVVLSACRTGTHETTARRVTTARGLDGAFLAAGARAVVSTLWAVDDATALVYSLVLHAHLGGGATVARAHTEAVSYLRERRWEAVGSDHATAAAEAALDDRRRGWRTELEGVDRLLGWATFKLSGVAWSRP